MRKHAAILTLIASLPLIGQNSPAHQTITDGFTPPGLGAGTPSGSYPLSGFDTIDYFSGKLNFRLPLVTVKGRGEVTFTAPIHIQSQWRVVDFYPPTCATEGCPVSYIESNNWDIAPFYSPGKMAYRTARSLSLQQPSNCIVADYTLTRLTFIGTDGSELPFIDKLNNGVALVNPSAPSCTFSGGDRGRIFTSTDGSAATFLSDTSLSDFKDPAAISSPSSEGTVSGLLFFKDGTRYQILGGLVSGIWDRHGNKTTFAYENPSTLGAANDSNTHALKTISDSLGRDVNIVYDISDLVTAEVCDYLTYDGFQSFQQRVAKVCHKSLDQALKSGFLVQTTAQLFPDSSAVQTVPFNPRVVSSVRLPNGKQYSFLYNSYGEVAKLTLPTGGYFEYTHGRGYSTDPQGGDLGGVYSLMVYRRVKDKKTYDENATLLLTETITGSPLLTTPFATTVVRKDAANIQLAKENHTFHASPISSVSVSPTGYPEWSEGKEYSMEEFAGSSSTSIRSTQMNWAQSGSSNLTDRQQDPHITQITTTTDSQTSSQVFCFDGFSNKTDVYEYDFGSAPTLATYCQLPNNTPVPAGYTRQTKSTYATQNYLSRDLINIVNSNGSLKTLNGEDGIYHQRNLPSDTTVYNSSNVIESQVTYTYDHNTLNYNPNTTTWTTATYTGLTNWDDPGRISRGNLTKVKKLLKNPVTNTTSNVDTTALEYDQVGNLTRMTMPVGQYSAAYSDTFGYAYPTNFKNPLGHLASRSYDTNTGLLSSFTGPTGFGITYGYESGLDRLNSITPTIGGATAITYNDTARTISTSSYQNSCANGNSLQGTKYFDGLGRQVKVQSIQGQGTSSVETQYDGLGRVSAVSRPSFSGTALWTTNTYDDLGRLLTVTDPSSTVTKYDYSGADVTMTEMYSAAGIIDKVRKSTYDAFGRLTQVIEDPGGKNFITTYGYSVLDNLKQVTQATPSTQQLRQFYYDTFSRLVKATNPESGDTLYEYDNNGNVTKKTDARNVSTTFSYDAANRISGKVYAGETGSNLAPSVSYTYWDSGSDSRCTNTQECKGLLRKITAGAFSTEFDFYDAKGRPGQSKQTVDGTVYSLSYTYNAASGVETTQLPSGKNIKNCFDSGNKLLSVSATAAGTTKTYASGAQYEAFGGLKQLDFGNGLREARSYNSHLDVQTILVTKPVIPVVNYMQLTNSYCSTDTLQLDCAANNGNLMKQQIQHSNGYTFNQTFGYDKLNRLTSASEAAAVTGGGWSQNYDHDRWGNHWLSSGVNVSAYTPTLISQFDPITNRLNYNSTYDTAGYMLTRGSNNLAWDAEGRLKSNAQPLNGTTYTTQYFYDGEGRRVKKLDVNNSKKTHYVYDASGKLAAEYSEVTPSGCNTCYMFADHLGSTRLVADANGNVKKRYDYLPFGEEISLKNQFLPLQVNGRTAEHESAPPMAQAFTGKERDAETVLDYFGARYMSAAQGRFTSPDAPFADQHVADPQSWNLYSYVRNNPLRFVDPTGNAIELTGDEEERKKALAAIQASLGNSKVSTNLYINPELDKKGNQTGRFFVGINGDASDFAKAGGLESGLAEVIGATSIVQFSLGTEVTFKQSFMDDLVGNATKSVARDFGGGITQRSDGTLSGHIQTVVDPNGLRKPDEAPRPTLGEAVAHEFGHALGFIREPGTPANRTNRLAVDNENAARSRGGAARGRRTTHLGGFPK